VTLVDRVLDATYDEVAERGLGALTVEAVAVRAGSSRATVYRHFPGGRDELIDRTIRREVRRFFDTVLAAAPAPPP
jgi:AcrR family transcriptional regulator